MNAKLNFRTKKELVKWWVAIAHDDKFADVLTHARAMIVEGTPSQEQLRGAEMLLTILETMTDNEEAANAFPSPGLIHQVEPPPRNPRKTKE